MKKVTLDDKKMVKLFVEKEKIVEEAKKVELEYEKQTKDYEEKIKKFTNKVGKIDTKLKPMVTTEISKLALGEYDEVQRAYHDDNKVVFDILTPDTVREEYIEKMKEKKEKEKEEENKNKK